MTDTFSASDGTEFGSLMMGDLMIVGSIYPDAARIAEKGNTK